MKKFVKTFLRQVGYELSPLRPPQSLKTLNPDITEWEWDVYSKVQRFTMLSLERVLANIRAVKHIAQKKIPGDIVECGVWRGGSSMSLAMALMRSGDTTRTLWMYDTYTGMTEPVEADVTHAGSSASSLLTAARQYEMAESSLILASASLEDVRRNMQTTGYPMSRIRFVRGPVEQTIPGDIPDRIALLRLDTDWYESTRHELINLYPRLSPGGILIIDDYGHWQGAQKAVDEFFEDEPIFLNRIDYTGRLAVKAG